MDRIEAYLKAEEFVGRIVEEHGLEQVEINTSMPTSLITSSPVRNQSTKVYQHIDHILLVADWLLNE